jgi:hypothetical protein
LKYLAAIKHGTLNIQEKAPWMRVKDTIVITHRSLSALLKINRVRMAEIEGSLNKLKARPSKKL